MFTVYVKIKSVDKNSGYILARPTRWFLVRDIISPFDQNKMKLGENLEISSVIDGIRYEIDTDLFGVPNSESPSKLNFFR